MESGTKLKIVAKAGQFYDKLIPVLRKFPKTQRYTLAENIEKETLACVRLIFRAAYQREARAQSLEDLRTRLHLINFLLRISFQQNFLKEGEYEGLTGMATEMGRMSSQWIKSEEGGKRSPKVTVEAKASSEQLNL